MKSITVITPSRVHLALIDLNGGLGRVDGGIGLSLSRPGFRITAQRADETEIAGPDESAQRAREAVELLREKCAVGQAKIEIKESIPAHVGLGSGTQLSMAIAQAMCKLYGIDLSHREMALAVERGGTSGIGVAAFFQGGFIVDGGHKFSADEQPPASSFVKGKLKGGIPFVKGESLLDPPLGKSFLDPPFGKSLLDPPFTKGGLGGFEAGYKDEKTSFLPSSASRGVEPPPVIARYDFPDWDVLIAVPNCRHISGEEEVNLFQTLCPLPLNDVQALSHIILMKLLPALVQWDLEAFGEAVDQIQNIAWKKVEVEEQDPVVRQVMAFLRDNGAYGVGLSSWGPAIFCFGENLRTLEARTREFLASTNAGGTCFLTRANNTGAAVIEEE
jgi:predicted sugar kinase